MSRAGVRAAVVSYLVNLNPPLPYVGQIYPARTYANEQDYVINMNNQAVQLSQSGSAAVLVVNIPRSKRQRRAITGRSPQPGTSQGPVNDTYIHDIALEVFFASTGGDPIAAQQDNDTICDALDVAIRADPTLGSAVWSSAEFTSGLTVDQGAPYTDDAGMTVFIPTVVRWQVWEWLAGYGV